MDTDFYAILGLDRSATADEIKDAYRRMVREHHPDANPNDRRSAELRIKEVFAAYAVLSDDGRRADYDRTHVQAPGEGPVQVRSGNFSTGPVAPASLMGRVREVRGLTMEEMAHQLGLSLANLYVMESRDSMPQSPVQLRTFTHMVDTAAQDLERRGKPAEATAIRASLNRKKMQRGVFR